MNPANETGNNECNAREGIHAAHAVQGVVLHGMALDVCAITSGHDIISSTS